MSNRHKWASKLKFYSAAIEKDKWDFVRAALIDLFLIVSTKRERERLEETHRRVQHISSSIIFSKLIYNFNWFRSYQSSWWWKIHMMYVIADRHDYVVTLIMFWSLSHKWIYWYLQNILSKAIILLLCYWYLWKILLF